MSTKFIIIACIAGQKAGLGHLKRCQVFGAYAQGNGWDVQLVLFDDGSKQNNRQITVPQCYVSPNDQDWPVALISKLKNYSISATVGITDLAQPLFFNTYKVDHWLGRFAEMVGSVMHFDIPGNNGLVRNHPSVKCDQLVIPYATDEKLPTGNWSILAGPQYAVLGDSFKFEKRRIRQDANRILITAGGSDSTSLTPKILKALENVNQLLEISVVIGPLFTSSNRKAIQELIVSSKHRIFVHEKAENLSKLMQECDLAIATSGLTKYELAATGTPAILLSIDKEHHEANKAFAALGTGRDLGLEHSTTAIFQEIESLLPDLTARKNMSYVGQLLVNCKGAGRLLQIIEQGV